MPTETYQNVIIGSGEGGSTSLGIWRNPGKKRRWWSDAGSLGLARTSTVFLVRMRFGALRTRAEVQNQRGYIKVNDRLETTARNVWAIGECPGSPQFTHASLDDFRVIRDNLAGVSRSTRNRTIPSCLFVDPPVAQIGLTETEARRQGIDVHIAKLPMIGVLRTRTIDETAYSGDVDRAFRRI